MKFFSSTKENNVVVFGISVYQIVLLDYNFAVRIANRIKDLFIFFHYFLIIL